MAISSTTAKELAFECGFELAGIAVAEPVEEFGRFATWRARDFAGEMGYLTDHRGDLRADPRNLLAEARSILCVGKLYNTAEPGNDETNPARAKISRYAWGTDYHELMRKRLEQLALRIRDEHGEPFAWRACVDTAPLLERSYARLAGLGWIGKNTCLINQQQGSWFFLGEILLSISLPPDVPAAGRCGTCTRCIDACPTEALVPDEERGWVLDARRCISYLTIEKRGAIAPDLAERTENHIFGCDICQQVCPWNGRAGVTDEPAFASHTDGLWLAELATLSEGAFRERFRQTPLWRAKYAGFLRNVAQAMGNSRRPELLEPLARLASHDDPVVAAAARMAHERLARAVRC